MKTPIFASLTSLMACACGSAPAAPPTALFVHGWASDARVWTPARERLSAPGVAVTLPGHGDPPAQGDVSLEGFTAAIEKARAGAQCLVIVAHSNGAYAALDYIGRYPDRVAALVIIEGTFRPPFTDPAAFERQIAEVDSRWDSVQEHPIGLAGARAETVDAVRQMFADTNRNTATRALEALLALRPFGEQRVEQPALFMLAESPLWSESELNTLREVAPRSRFVTISGASHWLPLDEPEAIANAVTQEVQSALCPSL